MLEHDDSDNGTAKSTLTMHDTREEALPSLLPSMDRIEDLDDMTIDTFILAGRLQGQTLKPPQVVFTKNAKTGNEKWWYDENCDFNAGEFGVGVVEEFEEGSIIEDEAVNIIDNMIKKRRLYYQIRLTITLKHLIQVLLWIAPTDISIITHLLLLMKNKVLCLIFKTTMI